MIKTIKNLEEMDAFASEVLSLLAPSRSAPNPATVLALHGDLGAGKTAFVKSLGKALRLRDNITSPTFVIIKIFNIQYSIFKKLIHVDAYRIENQNELEILGWEEMAANPQNLIAIEWPEKVVGLIPKEAIKINFEFVNEQTRKVETNLW